jgi:hypothetical protein
MFRYRHLFILQEALKYLKKLHLKSQIQKGSFSTQQFEQTKSDRAIQA